MNDKRLRLAVILSAAALIAVTVLAAVLSRGTGAGADSGGHAFPVYINEISAANSACPGPDGFVCDFIELYNSSYAAIDISGYKLSDNGQTAKYAFPAGTVMPGHSYAVVWCAAGRAAEGYADMGLQRAVFREGAGKVAFLLVFRHGTSLF